MDKTTLARTDNTGARGGPTAVEGVRAWAASAFRPRVTAHLLAAKHYFLGEPELRRISSIVQPAKQSIDIGGHHGVYTHFLARCSSWVHCYEPYPQDAEFLVQAFKGRNVTVYPCALSDHDGLGELHVPVGPLGETGGQPSLLPPRARSARHMQISVAVKRLDEIGHTDIGFIKIDAEGHERSVIAGASGLIEKELPTLLIEVHGYSENDVFEVFQAISAPGYTGWFLHSGKWTELEIFRLSEHARLESAGARGVCFRKNFLFLPRGARPKWTS